MTRFPSAKTQQLCRFSASISECVRNAALCATLCVLASCDHVSQWLRERETTEVSAAVSKRPVGVTYDVISSNAPRKQISVFFNGQAMARVLEPGDNWTGKTLLNYNNELLTKKDFNTETQDISTIDPMAYPAVLDANMAKRVNAKCIGEGVSKGYAYHRWTGKSQNGEWEVWTDDGDSFPIYYRSIKNGEVCTWTMVNSWIDGSTYNKPTFFTTEADPPPPEPVKTEEEIAEEERKKQEEKQQKAHHHIARRTHKRSQ